MWRGSRRPAQLSRLAGSVASFVIQHTAARGHLKASVLSVRTSHIVVCARTNAQPTTISVRTGRAFLVTASVTLQGAAQDLCQQTAILVRTWAWRYPQRRVPYTCSAYGRALLGTMRMDLPAYPVISTVRTGVMDLTHRTVSGVSLPPFNTRMGPLFVLIRVSRPLTTPSITRISMEFVSLVMRCVHRCLDVEAQAQANVYVALKHP